MHLENEKKKIISRAFLCWKRIHSIFLKSPILPSQSVKNQAKFTFIILIHRQIKHSAGKERKSKSSTNLFPIFFSNLSSSSNLSCYISPTIDSSPVGPAIESAKSVVKTGLFENGNSLKPQLFSRNTVITAEVLRSVELIFLWKGNKHWARGKENTQPLASDL